MLFTFPTSAGPRRVSEPDTAVSPLLPREADALRQRLMYEADEALMQGDERLADILAWRVAMLTSPAREVLA